jgi:hypothetical protein
MLFTLIYIGVNKMLVNLYVYEIPATDTANGYFLGETPAIPMGTNCRELAGELVEFYGDTKSSVISQVISVLKSKGLSGKIRLM